MKLLNIIFISLTALSLINCAHSVHQVHVSDFKNENSYYALEQGQMIKAQSEQFVIMGFVQETDYVNQAKNRLINQCPQGQIIGISTQFLTSLGFFSWTNKILMQGLCVKTSSALTKSSI